MMHEKLGWNIDNSYTELPEKFFSKVKTNRIEMPRLLVLNEDLCRALGLDITEIESKKGIDMLVGNHPIPGGIQLAQAYAGHQFGNFTMLGDGRAMLIGEHTTVDGKKFDVQLKGAGITPYSRGGDGLAALGPMLREYIISEAMHHLKIPTSRSLAVVSTGEPVFRERRLEGSVLTRIASSHIRVGTFQYAANFADVEHVKLLADYTIARHFPYIKSEENQYLALLKEVINLQAKLIAKWQLVGFIHGVMNTDNMLICGETIDYGPCAFMDNYNPDTVFSSIDRNGRYSYGNQPNIAGWNVTRFAETLLPLIADSLDESVAMVKAALKSYGNLYNNYWLQGMGLKLGLLRTDSEDERLIKTLLKLMHKHRSDFTNTFLGLTEEQYRSIDKSGLFEDADFKQWSKGWAKRLKGQDMGLEDCKEIMRSHNPVIIPRNYIVEEALEEATSKYDYMKFNDFINALKEPYNYNNINEKYMLLPDKLDTSYRTFCGT